MKVGDLATPTTETPSTTTTVPNTNIMIINPDDPYDIPEERAEAKDWLYYTFFKWTGGEDGTFSTWRERHVFLRGFRNGFGTTLFQKFDSCPSMWNDDAHYYESGQELGYVIKIGIQISAVWIFTQLGMISLAGGVDVPATVELNKENVMAIIQQIMTMLGR